MTLLEQFGFTEEDIPTTWTEMFSLLEALSHGLMREIPEASLLPPGFTRSDLMSNFLDSMVSDYLLWLDADEAHLERGNEILAGLLQAFERIDWSGLGVPEEFEDDMAFYYDDNAILLTNFAVTGPLELANTFAYSTVDIRPLALSIAEGEDAMIDMEMQMAFVNPYSEHKDAAMA